MSEEGSRSTGLALSAIAVAIISIGSIVAMIVIGRSMTSQLAGGDLSQLGTLADARTFAFWISVVMAPIALFLSIFAMIVRARCQGPKPILPMLALSLGMVLTGYVMWILLTLLSLSGQMH